MKLSDRLANLQAQRAQLGELLGEARAKAQFLSEQLLRCEGAIQIVQAMAAEEAEKPASVPVPNEAPAPAPPAVASGG